MRTIVHLSDLHFGRINEGLVPPMIEAVRHSAPDLVVISGDLTQRARTDQFREAKQFLDRLPQPQLVIPGNHDVPLYDVYRRFTQPFRKYRLWIAEELEPLYLDAELGVVSINTAHTMTLRGGGRIARVHVARGCERLRTLPEDRLKVVVTHHPFALPPLIKERYLVRGAVPAMTALIECGADLFLAGHIHVVHSELTTHRYHAASRSGLIVQAATGLSTRVRHGQANAFNVLRASRDEISVETNQWNGRAFAQTSEKRYGRTEKGWADLAAPGI